MSNAMRSAKRLLAGAAVAALGAELLTVVAAPASQAATGAWTKSNAGITIITADDTAGVANLPQTSIPIFVNIFDSITDLPGDLSAGETLTATVTTPTGAVGTAVTSFWLNDSAGTGAPAGFSAVSLSPVVEGAYGLTLTPRSAAVSTGAGTDLQAWGTTALQQPIVRRVLRPATTP